MFTLECYISLQKTFQCIIIHSNMEVSEFFFCDKINWKNMLIDFYVVNF